MMEEYTISVKVDPKWLDKWCKADIIENDIDTGWSYS